MTLRIPLVVINGRKVELPPEDKIPTMCVGTYVYEKELPAVLWRIEHNMNKQPSIQIVDSDGAVVHAKIVYKTEDTVEIHFAKPTSGKAFLN